jgi:hypothetical protein
LRAVTKFIAYFPVAGANPALVWLLGQLADGMAAWFCRSSITAPRTGGPLIIRRNIKLRLLKHEVDDERFLQIFADFAELIRRSERAYARLSG